MKKQVAQLKANAEGNLPLLQITDTHLFSDRDKDLLGIKTVQSYEAVIDHALRYSSECLAVLSTGDLSQDHSAQSYVNFSTHIKKLNMACYWLPGNHDIQAIMLPSLLQEGLAQTRQIISDYWQIIMLDSQVEGVVYGALSDQQICFLEKALSEFPEKHTLICIHHHVLPMGSKWLDQHILKNSQPFLDVISSFDNVRAVLSGHVHQAGDTLKDGVYFMTTPSTCVQFKEKSDDFSLDTRAPGYRYLSLNKGGDISTHIERIESGAFTVDSDAKGY
ncbi:3',5'-cyclic-AMP phosphodiesterase [Psychromonas antarctica]|uniref:3',5'-cyclic-AMP phosphodiesterase n=1 Tax=Psychromonas antarctica TaxID=67573 RepID=UPI001EE94B3C|nr:3',5'-cyclic-AMP phosphodiesterase [Psychromonas antarctica]MCG6201654.1 3',5'-cyclic-AMP phosphodiesterase [Psychromonas antarctica]